MPSVGSIDLRHPMLVSDGRVYKTIRIYYTLMW